jgi:hypothetical protein
LREFFQLWGTFGLQKGVSVSTVKHLLNVKINSELSCCEFDDVIKETNHF